MDGLHYVKLTHASGKAAGRRMGQVAVRTSNRSGLRTVRAIDCGYPWRRGAPDFLSVFLPKAHTHAYTQTHTQHTQRLATRATQRNNTAWCLTVRLHQASYIEGQENGNEKKRRNGWRKTIHYTFWTYKTGFYNCFRMGGWVIAGWRFSLRRRERAKADNDLRAGGTGSNKNNNNGNRASAATTTKNTHTHIHTAHGRAKRQTYVAGNRCSSSSSSNSSSSVCVS